MNNPDSVTGYRTIGRELTAQVGEKLDAFCAGVGTASTLMGIFTGTSSELNAVGAIDLAKELGPGKTVVTIAVDTGLKYLAGDLFSDGA